MPLRQVYYLTSKGPNGEGMMISSSRGVIFASNGSDFAERARAETSKLRDQINALRA